MTLLFAGHDTTTATVAFLFHELARRPDVADAIAEELAGARAAAGYAELMGGGLALLDRRARRDAAAVPAGVDRPAPRGPRRSSSTASRCRPGVPVNYSSYVLAPAARRLATTRRRSGPSASRRERRAALPKGAYVPFGGGSRQCIGMRFGQLEIKAIAARILREHRLELAPGHRLEVRQTPTLGPKGGLPMRVRRSVTRGCWQGARRGVISGVQSSQGERRG